MSSEVNPYLGINHMIIDWQTGDHKLSEPLSLELLLFLFFVSSPSHTVESFVLLFLRGCDLATSCGSAQRSENVAGKRGQMLHLASVFNSDPRSFMTH